MVSRFFTWPGGSKGKDKRRRGKMKSKLFPAILLIIFLSLLIMGCEKKSVKPGTTDWDAVKEIVSENPEIFALGIYDTAPDTPFYREITENSPDIDEGKLFEADSSHWVDYITLVWTDIIQGKFHYYTNGEWHEKKFMSKTWTNAYFERWGETYDLHRGWILEEFSGTLNWAQGPWMDSLRITSEGVDTTIPALLLWERNLIKKNNTLVFGPGKQVTFTLFVNPAESTDFSFLFIKEESSYEKIPFTYQGGNLSASWVTTSNPDIAKFYYSAIIDMVWRESVTIDTTECRFNASGIVYRIK